MIWISKLADTSNLAGQNPRMLNGRKPPKTANLLTTMPPPPSSSSSLSPLATWNPTQSYNKASRSCNKNLPPCYKNLRAMTRGLAKRTRMALEDKVPMVCHRAGSMGSIKDIQRRMSMEERRVPGVEGQRLMVRLPMDKTDGINNEAIGKGSVYQQALKRALGACSEVTWPSLESLKIKVSTREIILSYTNHFGLFVAKKRILLPLLCDSMKRCHVGCHKLNASLRSLG